MINIKLNFFLKLRFLRDLGKQGYFIHKNIDIINIFFGGDGEGGQVYHFLFTCNIFLIAKNQWFLERGISLFIYFFWMYIYLDSFLYFYRAFLLYNRRLNMLKNVEHSPVIWLRMRIQPDRIIIFIRLKLISRPYIDHSILKIKLNGTVK